MTAWPPVALDVALRDLSARRIAVAGTGSDGRETMVYVQLDRARPGRVHLALCDMATRTPLPPQVRLHVSNQLTLREAVLAHVDVEARTAAEMPGLKWPLGSNPSGRNAWVWLTVPLIVFLLADSPEMVVVFLVVSFVVLGIRLGPGNAMTRGQILPTARDEAGRDLLPSRVRALLPPPAVAGAGAATPAERIAAVRDSYAALRDDIGYRIENSALFDSAHPATEAFELALLTFAPGSDDAERAARTVETTFTVARREAERLGYQHLPATARDTARRARLAATTALSSASEPERVAARLKVADLLGSLALYYLPTIDPDSPQLVARRREIEPLR